MIAACCGLSEEMRASGVTSAMREGALISALCLEDRVTEVFEQMLDPESRYVREKVPEIRAKVRQVGAAVAELSWALFNENRFCRAGRNCGSLYHPLHKAKMAEAYEILLRDALAHRERMCRQAPGALEEAGGLCDRRPNLGS
jgi:hypothetical protein